MMFLSCDCSAKSASCAISDGEKILASSFINVPLTHSQTLMPMISDMLKNSKISLGDINAFAVSAGPGSFTGVRIGISAVKGMALAGNIPCVPVSTLEAVAYNFLGRDVLVCAVMDARAKQVYAALFRVKGSKVKRICEDKAVSIEELAGEIKKSRVKCPIIIAGDGAEVFFPAVEGKSGVVTADADNLYQKAVGVALCAFNKYKKGESVPPEQLLPIYLRLPQAERELKKKKGE